jgi:Rieske Fe-S protein
MSQSRRQFLKIMAAAPLILPFGLTASPLMRYLKPTMKPGGFFDPADLPGSADVIQFTRNDFPKPWTCLPFMYPLKIAEFNPEGEEIREIPVFIIRLEGNEFVAYSRICPKAHPYKCVLNYLPEPEYCHCGCFSKSKKCSSDVPNPVLFCPCTGITFDIANGARVIGTSGLRPPRKIELTRQNDKIALGCFEGGIIR